jgi:hypothetical protein
MSRLLTSCVIAGLLSAPAIALAQGTGGRSGGAGTGTQGGQGSGQAGGQGSGQGAKPSADPFDQMVDAVLNSEKAKDYIKKHSKPQTNPGGHVQVKPYRGGGGHVRQTGGVKKLVGSKALMVTGAEVDFTSSQGFMTTSLLGGVMFMMPGEQSYVPFVDAMAGFAFCCDDSAFVLQFGGGLDFETGGRYTPRVSVVWRRLSYEGFSENALAIRFGVVFGTRR